MGTDCWTWDRPLHGCERVFPYSGRNRVPHATVHRPTGTGPLPRMRGTAFDRPRPPPLPPHTSVFLRATHSIQAACLPPRPTRPLVSAQHHRNIVLYCIYFAFYSLHLFGIHCTRTHTLFTRSPAEITSPSPYMHIPSAPLIFTHLSPHITIVLCCIWLCIDIACMLTYLSYSHAQLHVYLYPSYPFLHRYPRPYFPYYSPIPLPYPLDPPCIIVSSI